MSGFISARQVVTALKGRWAGRGGMCRCPAHQDKTPSLSIGETRDGRVLVRCFAGCDQMVVIGALKARGLWGSGEVTMDPSYPGSFTTAHDRARDKEDRRTKEYALTLWERALAAKGSPVEAYLRARGIRLPISDQLRFIPHLKHTSSGRFFPVMVARIADERGFCAIQRTYLDENLPQKADLSDEKMSLSRMGAGAIRLREPGVVLGLAEGIETALSSTQLYQITTWATCSATRLGTIEIPKQVRSIIIFADAGKPGMTQAIKAADRYEHKGYPVEIITPSAHYEGTKAGDFNDILKDPIYV